MGHWGKEKWNCDGMRAADWARIKNLRPTFFFFFNVCLFLREKEREWRRGREEDTESEAGSRLPAVSTDLDTGPELMSREIMT